MISVVAQVLVLSGAVILAIALFPIRRLISRVPSGSLRGHWYAMTALIVLFLVGYVGYAVAFWTRHSGPLDLIVPIIFFSGACFVWLTAVLSLRTAMDVMRISLLERESITDPLTGVFNRRHLERRLGEEVARARRYGLPLSMLLIDIDHFKHVNDRYGHMAGDQVLVAIGRLVAGSLRESDVLARYGGEEFLVITPQTARAGAVEIAERVRRQIEAHRFDAPDGTGGLSVTASIGVASLAEDIASGQELIHAADQSLYRAKQQGRNQVWSGASVPDPAAR